MHVQISKWVCLKMEYTPQNGYLYGNNSENMIDSSMGFGLSSEQLIRLSKHHWHLQHLQVEQWWNTIANHIFGYWSWWSMSSFWLNQKTSRAWKQLKCWAIWGWFPNPVPIIPVTSWREVVFHLFRTIYNIYIYTRIYIYTYFPSITSVYRRIFHCPPVI